VIFATYQQDDKIKEDGIAESYSTHEEDEKHIRDLSEDLEERDRLDDLGLDGPEVHRIQWCGLDSFFSQY
jgi:hypothetical protein